MLAQHVVVKKPFAVVAFYQDVSDLSGGKHCGSGRSWRVGVGVDFVEVAPRKRYAQAKNGRTAFRKYVFHVKLFLEV
jgi:hypothetical protein